MAIWRPKWSRDDGHFATQVVLDDGHFAAKAGVERRLFGGQRDDGHLATQVVLDDGHFAAKAGVERRLFGGQSGRGATAILRTKWIWGGGQLAAKVALGRRPFGGTAAIWHTKLSWDDAHLETKVCLGRWPFGDPSGPGTGTAPELARAGAPPLGVRKHRFYMNWMPGGAHGHHTVARRAHLGSRFSHPQDTDFDGVLTAGGGGGDVLFFFFFFFSNVIILKVRYI